MNTQVQKIKDEIERRVNQFKHARQEAEYDANKLSLGARIAMCEELLVFINSLLEEPILNDAVEKQIDKISEERQICDGRMRTCGRYYDDWFKEGAKFGANWQKKQMIKDATYATCCGLHAFQALWCFDNLKTSDVVAGDRIKVIIIKEDEQ